MKSFYEKISQTCKKYKKVAMFIDMDGTISEYHVYEEEKMPINTKGVAINQKPLNNIIEKLKMISNIHNIDLYILTLSKSNLITKEKKEWLKKYISFIKKEKENGKAISQAFEDYEKQYIKTSFVDLSEVYLVLGLKSRSINILNKIIYNSNMEFYNRERAIVQKERIEKEITAQNMNKDDKDYTD